MTTVSIPKGAAWKAVDLCADAGLRAPEVQGPPEAAVLDLVWTPDLSAADLATARDIVSTASLLLSLSLAEWQAIKPDVAGLITYQGLASPTLAQTVAAVKAQSRILRAILRN
jgi:hypothetical protein